MTNEERSAFTETSRPVSEKNTLFMWAENAAAEKPSPFLFCGKIKMGFNTNQNIVWWLTEGLGQN